MNVLVLGLGITGMGAIKLLKEKGFNIIAVDNVNETSLLDMDVKFILKSPGIYNSNTLLIEAKRRGITIISDIELAYLLKTMKYIAITGTNGKSTVTTLVYEMLKDNAILGGNIGLSICEQVINTNKEYAVCELSSFQLDDIKAFKPHIACILNLDDDHLKYHGSIENYHKAKLRIIENFKSNDVLICSKEVYELVKDRDIKTLVFDESFIKDSKIIYDDDLTINLNDLLIIGHHNHLNIIASIMIAKELGVSNSVIRKVIKNFKGLPYRLEYVKSVNYKVIYNDSKATNIDSTNKAISSFDESIILLLGGYDKGQDYKTLDLKNVVKVIAFGASKDRIYNSLDNVILAKDIKEAMDIALKQNGNIILFSPGHSSYDQFSSYEERGLYFNNLVKLY